MKTWYVKKGSNGNGSSPDAAFGSLAEAERAVAPGDEVIVALGMYREQLTLTTPRVTWRSAEKHQAVLDGGYNWSLGTPRGLTAAPSMPVPGPGHLPGGADAERRGAMVLINAEGVTWQDFCIQNVSGEGIEILEPNVTVRGCAFYCCYSTAVQCNDTAERDTHHILVEDCDIVWTSLRTFALGETEASGAIKFGNTNEGNAIRNCRLWLAGGEGLNIGKRTKATTAEPFIVEGCTLMDANHTSLYAVQAENVVFRGNVVVYHENVNPYSKAGRKAGSAALRIKDEDSKATPVNSRNIRFLGNLAVNARLLVEVGGDDITQYGCEAHGNTLISGPYTLKGASLIHGANQQGTEVDFRRNAIHWGRHLPDAVGISDGPRTRCTFRDNAWSERPAESHRGEGDYYGDLGLNAPDTPLLATGNAFCLSWAEWQRVGLRSSFDLANYRPRQNSPLVRGGVTWGALPAGPVGPPPPEEEPPGVNWDSLIARAASIGVQVATQAEELQGVRSDIDALKERHAILALSNEQMAMELGELLLALDEYKQAAESGEE